MSWRLKKRKEKKRVFALREISTVKKPNRIRMRATPGAASKTLGRSVMGASVQFGETKGRR